MKESHRFSLELVAEPAIYAMRNEIITVKSNNPGFIHCNTITGENRTSYICNGINYIGVDQNEFFLSVEGEN